MILHSFTCAYCGKIRHRQESDYNASAWSQRRYCKDECKRLAHNERLRVEHHNPKEDLIALLRLRRTAKPIEPKPVLSRARTLAEAYELDQKGSA